MANHCHWELITSGGWLLASDESCVDGIIRLLQLSTPTSIYNFLPSILLSMIVVTIVGVVVVAAGIVVESSSVVKLSFVVVERLSCNSLVVSHFLTAGVPVRNGVPVRDY
ncbi:hypothetical protein Tco_0725845 [Tanacetum coccineum]|uniref:Transmembrane protein n=1 Tax=Tanacetum coccineum TaxID=301880 RepID=A0ABQ4YE27_9ASTR